MVVNWRELPYSGFSFTMADLQLEDEDLPVSIIDLYTDEIVASAKKDSDTVEVGELLGHGSKVFRIKKAGNRKKDFMQ